VPHIDIRFKPSVRPELLLDAAPQMAAIVGAHFAENPEYVSVEVVPQTRWTRNRKDVDVEVNASPDLMGVRAKAAKALTVALADFIANYLRGNGTDCEVSAWVRLFSEGVYEYRQTKTGLPL
jgi:hypothetical protein